MIRLIFTLATILILSCHIWAQGIIFEKGSLAGAKEKAKKEDKFLFVDCYTTWCGPCKALDKNIFTQDSVGYFFNKHFINVKLDLETEEGKVFDREHSITAVPTLIWLDGNGNWQHTSVGMCTGRELINKGKLALDIESNLNGLKTRWQSGERNEDFVKTFIKEGGEGNLDVKEAIQYYFFDTRKEIDLINAEDLDLMWSVVKDSQDPVFAVLVRNRKAFETFDNGLDLSRQLEYKLKNEFGYLVRNEEYDDLENRRKKLVANDQQLGAKLGSWIIVCKYAKAGDKERYYDKFISYTLKYDKKQPAGMLGCVRQILAEAEELSPTIQNRLITVLEQTIEMLDGPYAYDTYAELLHKVGRVDEAKVKADKAVTLAKENEKAYLWSSKFLSGEFD